MCIYIYIYSKARCDFCRNRQVQATRCWTAVRRKKDVRGASETKSVWNHVVFLLGVVYEESLKFWWRSKVDKSHLNRMTFNVETTTTYLLKLHEFEPDPTPIQITSSTPIIFTEYLSQLIIQKSNKVLCSEDDRLVVIKGQIK